LQQNGDMQKEKVRGGGNMFQTQKMTSEREKFKKKK